MSCIYKCGNQCSLGSDGIGEPDYCIGEENCPLGTDDEDEYEEDQE